MIGLVVMLLARCGGKTDRPETVAPVSTHQFLNTTHYYLGWVDPFGGKNTTDNPFGQMSLSAWHDSNAFGNMVGYGFVFITLVLLVSIVFGERAPVRVSS